MTTANRDWTEHFGIQSILKKLAQERQGRFYGGLAFAASLSIAKWIDDVQTFVERHVVLHVL